MAAALMRSEMRSKLAWCLAQPGTFTQGDMQLDFDVHQTTTGKLFWRFEKLGLLKMTPVVGSRNVRQLWQVADRDRAESILAGRATVDYVPRRKPAKKAKLINSVWSLAK
jgi:hypothetical protein